MKRPFAGECWSEDPFHPVHAPLMWRYIRPTSSTFPWYNVAWFCDVLTYFRDNFWKAVTIKSCSMFKKKCWPFKVASGRTCLSPLVQYVYYVARILHLKCVMFLCLPSTSLNNTMQTINIICLRSFIYRSTLAESSLTSHSGYIGRGSFANQLERLSSQQW